MLQVVFQRAFFTDPSQPDSACFAIMPCCWSFTCSRGCT